LLNSPAARDSVAGQGALIWRNGLFNTIHTETSCEYTAPVKLMSNIVAASALFDLLGTAIDVAGALISSG
jgi:hypothetical protein